MAVTRPAQYAIYKGVGGKWGAVQFNPKYPQNDDDRPAVFLEATSAKGPNLYDWEQKIIFALGVNDLSQILHFIRTGVKPGGEKNSLHLLHDPNAKSNRAGSITKSLTLDSPNGTVAGCMLTLTEKKGDDIKSHKVPVSGHELQALSLLIQTAIPKLLSWD